MQRITITIPRQYNDRTNVSESKFQRIERDIISLFGGYSRVDVAGAWTDESGKTIYENNFRYEILTTYLHAYRQLKTYAYRVGRDLDQFSVLTTYEIVQVDFVEK